MNIHKIYQPFLKYFRQKRMRRFREQFAITPETRILDVGGSEFNWSLLSTTPQLTILNISTPEVGSANNYHWLIADGRYLPFKSRSFDIVYSNSVIEHLSNIDNQRLYSDEIQIVGIQYYIQTPNLGFFIEPHLLTPFIHWFPRRIQKRMLRNLTVWGLITRPSNEYCEKIYQDIRLLNEKEFRELFSDADIWHERFLGITKSLIAVKICP